MSRNPISRAWIGRRLKTAGAGSAIAERGSEANRPPVASWRWRRSRLLVFAAGFVVVALVGVGIVILGSADRDQVTGEDGDAETIFGFWEVVELDGASTVERMSVTFTLEPDYNSRNDDESGSALLTIAGSDGCNGFGGAYVVSGDHVEVPSLWTNLIGCSSEVLDQADRFTGSLSSRWSVTSGRLVLTGDNGAVAVLREVTDGAVGVWALAEVDGRPVDTGASITVWPGNRFAGYAGCWISGNYEMAGDRLILSGAIALTAQTTTVPSPPPENYVPGNNEPVPPLFGCEEVSGDERQFLTLVGSGQGVIDGDEMTISNGAGATLVFRRA